MNCTICGSDRAKIVRDYASPFVSRRHTLFEYGTCRSHFFDVGQYPIDRPFNCLPIFDRMYSDCQNP